MAYVLATTETVVRWYTFDTSAAEPRSTLALLPTLDLAKVPQLGDKATAREAAKALGLQTWRYVKVG